MKEIDISTWVRKAHYETFGNYINPSFKIEVRLDMTHFMNNKPTDDGFFIPFTYLLMRAINDYEGFRIRYLDGKIYSYPSVSPSYTVLLDNNNFAFKATEYTSSYSDFVKSMKADIQFAKTAALKQDNEKMYQTNNRADLVYISCLPWLDVVSIDNPLPYDNKMSMSIPRANWGKCVKEGNKYSMTLSLTINHAYIDGYEACCMINQLQKDLDICENFFNSSTISTHKKENSTDEG